MSPPQSPPAAPLVDAADTGAQGVSVSDAAQATTTSDLQPPARSSLTPVVAQHSPYLIHGSNTPSSTHSGSSVSVNAGAGASTSTPSLFAFISQLALHDGHAVARRAGPLAQGQAGHAASVQEGVESGGMSEEEFSDSSDTEEGSTFDGRSTPASAVTRSSGGADDEDEKGDLAPLPDQATIGKHQVFRPAPAARQGSNDGPDISNRLAQLAVSNLAAHGTSSATDEPRVDDGWTDADRLAAINEEFGRFEQHCGPDGAAQAVDERYIAEATGGLFRGIVIIGNLHLTSHRLTFLARMPPISQETLKSGSLLKAGAVYILKKRTRLGVSCTKKKRVWLELSADMATTYPDSTEAGRTRPLKTVLLASIRRIREQTEDRVIEVELYTPAGAPPDVRRMEFDTHESCLAWRREFEAALFHYDRQRRLLARKDPEWHRRLLARKDHPSTAAAGQYGDADGEWERVRVSLPLVRIDKEQMSDYMGFAALLDLEVNYESPSAFAARANAALGDGSQAASPGGADRNLPPASKLHVQFALLSSQRSFVDAFQHAHAEALRRCKRSGAAGAECMPPLVDLEDAFRDYLRRGEDGEIAETEGAGAGEDVTEQTLRNVFGLGNTEGLWSITCGLQRSFVPLKGQLVVSPQYIGFYRKAYAGADVQVRFKISDVKGATKWATSHLSTKGLALSIDGHPDVHLEFFSAQNRDTAIERVNDAVAWASRGNPPPAPASPAYLPADSPFNEVSTPASSATDLASLAGTGSVSPSASSGHQRQASRTDDILTASLRSPDGNGPNFSDAVYNYVPRVVNLPQERSERTGKRVAPRHFCMLTIGSRGDVEPYIALSRGLMLEGHRCTIITHDEFQEWIEGFGIGFRQAGGDPAALMKLSVEHKMFSPGFFKESLSHFRQWLDDLFHDAWVACHDADVLIESPSAMAGIHIAEAKGIPYFRAFTMPWTRTHDYPHAFMVPQFEMSAQFNYATYVLFDNLMWKATAGQVNRWRRKELDLPPTDMSHLKAGQVPFVYNFSSAVVPKPLDWKDQIMISGYWFMPDEKDEWTPPADLDAFMKQARADGKPLVYIGFGSIVVPHPSETTRNVIRAVERSGVRAIVAKGWSGRGNEVDKDGLPIEVPFPASCFSLEKVPHNWLFKRVDAAVHHGGAGTTGASLRAGIPTIICPWFGDQFHWALRVNKLGVGVRVTSLSGHELADALVRATTDTLMREKAAKIGEKIRAERGVEKTIEWMYEHLERARDRHHHSAHHHHHRSSSPALRPDGTSPRGSSPAPSNPSSPGGSPRGGAIKALPGLSSIGSKGLKGFKEAGSAVVAVGRLGSALKGVAKGAGSGSAA